MDSRFRTNPPPIAKDGTFQALAPTFELKNRAYVSPTDPFHRNFSDVMSSTSNARTVAGARVHALARHVTSLAECARRYGAEKNTRFVSGTVICARTDTSGARANTFVTAEYEFMGDHRKTKELNIRSVRAGEAPEPPAAIGAVRMPPHVPEHAETERRAEHDEQGRSPENVLTVGGEETPGSFSGTTAPFATVHGTVWERGAAGELQLPVNGPVQPRPWFVTSPTGMRIGEGDPLCRDMSPLDVFMLMFPPEQLEEMRRLTNKGLRDIGKKETTCGELLAFFGLLILMTRRKFTSRGSLWSKTTQFKYETAPDFGRTRFSKTRFELIMRCVRYSEQPAERPSDMSSEAYRWLLVDGFIERFNSYRQRMFSPSDLICVDESMSRWYGIGGSWLGDGLPMYIQIDRKPENGCEIQNSACGRSGIMMRLKLVKSASPSTESREEPSDAVLTHGALVLKELVLPWARSGRIVAADSYFASVSAAEELFRCGLRFIGVLHQ